MPSTVVRSHSSPDDDRPAEVLVVREVAAREPQQLDGGKEPVADAERVGRDPSPRVPASTRQSRVDGRVDDLLHPPVALRPHDDAPVAERHAVAQEPRAVADGARAAAARCRARPRGAAATSRGPGPGPASSTVVDVRAVAAQLRREGERERPAAGEDDPLARAGSAGS